MNMRYRCSDRPTGALVSRGMIAALFSAVIGAGCDSAPGELVRDIDAARGGCTEEMLKAADDECVRMFETYADMAAGAMETYIGGMRAFDEAIRRRGGLQFDTAGLGNAVGDGWRAPVDPAGWVGAAVPGRRELEPMPGGYDPMSDPYYAENPYGPASGGRWSDPVNGGGVTAQPYPQGVVDEGRPAAAGGRVSAGRRGVLLPPEERLQRPWIDDGGADDGYVPEGRVREPSPAPGGQGPGWYPYPNGAPGGYPYAAPRGYPYGTPGSYPYPYGSPGAAPYPYGGTGSAYPYPYPQPGPEMYPYPDSRPGSW